MEKVAASSNRRVFLQEFELISCFADCVDHAVIQDLVALCDLLEQMVDALTIISVACSS